MVSKMYQILLIRRCAKKKVEYGKIKGGKLGHAKFYPPPYVTIAKKKFVFIKF